MRRALALLTVAAVTLLGAPSSSAEQAPYYCSEGAPPPCVTSAKVNGTDVPAGDPQWDVIVTPVTGTGSTEFLWNVQRDGGPDPYELGKASLSDVWTIRFNTGSMVPRVAFTHGAKVSVVRGSGEVSVTASPTTVVGECDQSAWPWKCPETATQDREAYLGGHVTDYGVWEDAAQRTAMNGMDFATNISATSIPPEIVNDPKGKDQLLVRLANPHFRADGKTVFSGFAHLRIPNEFLKKAYGIDDPATLTGKGLAPVVSGPKTGSGTVAVYQETGGTAMLVDVTNLTFSARTVEIRRGVITPTKPRKVRGSGDVLRFKPARARGSKITGYEAKCSTGSSTVTERSKRSPIRVSGLGGGTATCRVRAISKQGPGRWSRKTAL